MNKEMLLNGAVFASVGLLIITCIMLVVAIVLIIIGQWKIFQKANKPDWAILVPIYNIYISLKIVKMNWWHLIIIVPLLIMSYIENNTIMIIGTIGLFVYEFIMNIKLAKLFGKTTGFGVFTTFFPFIGYMILGCGSATYQEK